MSDLAVRMVKEQLAKHYPGYKQVQHVTGTTHITVTVYGEKKGRWPWSPREEVTKRVDLLGRMKWDSIQESWFGRPVGNDGPGSAIFEPVPETREVHWAFEI